MLTNLLVVLLLTTGANSLAPKWMQPSADGRSSDSTVVQVAAPSESISKSDKHAEKPGSGAAVGKDSVKSTRIETAQALSPSSVAQEAANQAVINASAGADAEPAIRTTPLRDEAMIALIESLKGQPDNLRVMRARLKGSLCVSCLMQLEKKVREQDGIKYARVIRPAPNGGPVVYEPRYAQIEIIYLMDKQNPKKLKKIIERNDFGTRDEKDEQMTSNFTPMADPGIPAAKTQ